MSELLKWCYFCVKHTFRLGPLKNVCNGCKRTYEESETLERIRKAEGAQDPEDA